MQPGRIWAIWPRKMGQIQRTGICKSFITFSIPIIMDIWYVSKKWSFPCLQRWVWSFYFEKITVFRSLFVICIERYKITHQNSWTIWCVLLSKRFKELHLFCSSDKIFNDDLIFCFAEKEKIYNLCIKKRRKKDLWVETRYIHTLKLCREF